MLSQARQVISKLTGQAESETDIYQPHLEIKSNEHLETIKNKEMTWYHTIDLGDGLTTPGRSNHKLWGMVASFLKKHGEVVDGNEVLELGPADGLWSCWFTKLGCSQITATDHIDYATYRMIVDTYGLPVKYLPKVLSGETPYHVKQKFPVVASLGVLYHVHDPLNALAMYHLFLKDKGHLFVETACIQEETPILYLNSDGNVLPKNGNNLFAPTTGFMEATLQQLGHEIVDKDFVFMRKADKIGRDFGRAVYLSRPVEKVKMSNFNAFKRQLGFETNPGQRKVA